MDTVGKSVVDEQVSGCLGTTFITTFFRPLKIPATGVKVRLAGLVTVPA